ncbi:HutD family protein [Pararobbsia alpina]|uniref:HutD/Ves family protein n=1 Tax=Pararobbsia alpina TaxID=621374 RepID=UPI0015823FBE
MALGAGVALIRGAELVAAPWKNGGGLTREIAAFPTGAALDAFVWRVSIAEVASSGAFSVFAGVDRTLVLLAGAGMMLNEAGGATLPLVQSLDIARFAGEAAIDARLVDGATRDFNLMVRRGAAVGEVSVVRGGASSTCTLRADVVLLFCAAGSIEVTVGEDDAIGLSVDDTLRVDSPDALRCVVGGEGHALVVSIRYSRSI